MNTPQIVVGIDGSEQSSLALMWAAQQAKSTGSQLLVVHAWRPPAVDEIAGGHRFRELTLGDARTRASRWVHEAVGDDLQPGWELAVLEGSAGRLLVELSKDARLLVVGTREHVGLRRIATGSVSHYCLTHSSCPIVAVPPTMVAASATKEPVS